MLKQNIIEAARKYKTEFIGIRQHLHAHPELSYQEFETAAFVKQKLTEWGITHTTLASTGVVGIIEGKNANKKVIALRADMDALPITEENDVPYASKNPGIMHACGHDVHTTCLLGAAKILNEHKADWEGTVKLIFQPGEEKNPGGASIMIKEGVLENPTPEAIFGLHVHPGLPTGKLSFRAGKVMASADEIYITVKGKGGHAAAPHLAVDPILITSHLVVALQQVISRHCNPHNPSVLSITSIHGGTTTNIIPDTVTLMGTFRAMDEEWRFKAHDLIKHSTSTLAASMGGSAEIKIDVGYPTVYNNATLHEAACTLASDFLGAAHIEETELRMGAEDFGYYSQQIPGCFFRLGVMNQEKGILHGVHTARFNIDEEAIEIGMGIMAWLGASAKI